MQKLTLEQALILTGYTGVLCCDFAAFHKDVEQRAQRPVLTHELAGKKGLTMAKALYREDFFALLPV